MEFGLGWANFCRTWLEHQRNVKWPDQNRGLSPEIFQDTFALIAWSITTCKAGALIHCVKPTCVPAPGGVKGDRDKYNYHINQSCFRDTLPNFPHSPSYFDLENHLQRIVYLVSFRKLNLESSIWFSSDEKKKHCFLNWQLLRMLLLTLVGRGKHKTQIWKRVWYPKIEYVLQISDTLPLGLL